MKQKKELSKLSKMELAPMSQNELNKFNGGAWPLVVGAAAAGYAAGTVYSAYSRYGVVAGTLVGAGMFFGGVGFAISFAYGGGRVNQPNLF